MNVIRKGLVVVALSSLLVPVYAQNIGFSIGPNGIGVHHNLDRSNRGVVHDRDFDRHHHNGFSVNGHRVVVHDRDYHHPHHRDVHRHHGNVIWVR
jgi:hypothetical protein